jgi:hypothetical protein
MDAAGRMSRVQKLYFLSSSHACLLVAEPGNAVLLQQSQSRPQMSLFISYLPEDKTKVLAREKGNNFDTQ